MTTLSDTALLEPPTAVSPQHPAVFRAGATPARRTLLDILEDTARRHPGAPAIDDGTRVLTYRALLAEVGEMRRALHAQGIGLGDRVGIRVPSGTIDLYVSILGTLAAGAAYVPVDFEDPDERANTVFTEADVCAELGEDRKLTMRGVALNLCDRPDPADDAWIIFTSGSTGKPKGVAVTHHSAAAFVDAEARIFLQEEPMGPGDRVLAGLSVAFDASCEEMWLAWRHGACLVPAPRALVRTGMDLGPWLAEREITVVSTVPTLAALWPVEALDEVRLLIFGGEACPPELAERMAVEGREVWNTYGPTEATVVACAAQLTGDEPIRIGLPLDGWELAVVGADGRPVEMGESGELVIGGVGLARYLDADKDAEKYAPLPSMGWDRAYRSGDLVCAQPEGLLFLGRADEQVKLGGRRIELGEVDSALQALPNVAGAAAAVRTTKGGNQILVGYVVPADDKFDQAEALEILRAELPAALVPLLATVDTLPTKTSGKVDRAALPWPLPNLNPTTEKTGELTPLQAWLAEQWGEVLGLPPGDAQADFFGSGGTSLSAARLISLVRTRYPAISVSDLYQRPVLAAQAEYLGQFDTETTKIKKVRPTKTKAKVLQTMAMLPLLTVVGARWVVGLAVINNLLALTGTFAWAPTVPWLYVGLGWLLLVSPPGRIAMTVIAAKLLLRNVKPGNYKRGGRIHMRLWTVERIAELTGAGNLPGVWNTVYARRLGVKVGDGVDLHSPPPVTGMLKLGKGCAIEPEVDLSGHWLDGDTLRIGRIRVGAGATVGSRSTLLPGARVGKHAEVAPGSGVIGSVRPGTRVAGVPAARTGKASQNWPSRKAPRLRRWQAIYALTSMALGGLPVVAMAAPLYIVGSFLSGQSTLGGATQQALLAVPLATVAWFASYALLILVSVRLLSIGLKAGYHPVHSRVAWQAWATERLMDAARQSLFPMYASLATPVWLRALGMKVGRRVEASTVLALPKMTTVGDGAFLADDTMVASYELGGGWLHIASAKIGKKAFLGNSGMTAAGRSVPNRGLVGVLSSTPKGAKRGDSYLGMPPMLLPRAADKADNSRTFNPPAYLMWARGLVEACRILPVMCTVALLVLAAATGEWLLGKIGPLWTIAAGGGILLAGGLVACTIAVAAKWILVGRFRAVEHPLWSGFVWRNELADTFIEVLAVPWLVRAVSGTPLMSMWLRALGAQVGRGVWCESYWLPESDLVTLGDGATVNRGCVVQTHLFHDRIMRMDTVTLEPGSTLGPHGIVLPGAAIGAHTTVGPASLVMRGESVPSGTRWIGNPITSWR
ncbi:amino acid adenylation protein [Pseudonocardiaceae bacterium YIM PH 21723]|nr:amino acid adenylation protein [Pseudonocardiaceae bacterium YIM PH 21723]